MNLIEKFENMPFQDVGTFNSIFRNSPIIGFPFNSEVEIGELTSDNKRKIKVGQEVLFLDLTQKTVKERKVINKRPAKKLEVVKDKDKKELSSIFNTLNPSSFMIYHAVKELGEVNGIQELSRALPISAKTITKSVDFLVKVNLISKKKVFNGEKTFNKLYID